MLTVLVLDALALAEGGQQVPFRLQGANNAGGIRGPSPAPTDADIPDPVYDCDGAAWHEPPTAPTTSVGLREAKKMVKPKLAVVVATETELRQVLRVLKPLPRRPRISKTATRRLTPLAGHPGPGDDECLLPDQLC
jgi:hypothetical protein